MYPVVVESGLSRDRTITIPSSQKFRLITRMEELRVLSSTMSDAWLTTRYNYPVNSPPVGILNSGSSFVRCVVGMAA